MMTIATTITAYVDCVGCVDVDVDVDVDDVDVDVVRLDEVGTCPGNCRGSFFLRDFLRGKPPTALGTTHHCCLLVQDTTNAF